MSLSFDNFLCAVFKVRFISDATKNGIHGLKWTRTTDLTLIRRAL